MNQVEVKKQQIKRLSYIIGCIGLLLLGNVLGNNGIAYLGAAYECYSFFWILLGSNVADALGKMLRGRSAKGQYRNAARARRYIMLFQCFLGIVGGILLIFVGGLVMNRVFLMPHGSFVTTVLAPAFFLRMVGGVLSGYLQGDGSEFPAAISGLLRQVFFVGFGFLFGNLLKGYGVKVSVLLGQEDFICMYSAIGVGIAIVLAELLNVLFLLMICRGSRKKAKNNPSDGMRVTDSFGGLIGILYGNMIWGILIQLFARLPIWLGIIFLQKSVAENQMVITSYGEYYGKYLAVGGILVLLTDIVLTAACARVYSHLKRDEQNYAAIGFQGGLHLAAVQGLYFAALLTVMGNQIAGLLCKDSAESAAAMISQGAFAIGFIILAAYFARLLILGKSQHLVVAGLGIMNVVFMISAAVFLNSGNMGILSLVYAGLLAAAALSVSLGFFACRQLGMTIDWLQTFGLPVGGACISGGLCLALGKALTPHLGNGVTLLVCFIVSYILYLAILIFLRNFRESELRVIPCGNLIRALGQLLQIYR